MRNANSHLLRRIALALMALACCTKEPSPRHPTEAWFAARRSELRYGLNSCGGYFVEPIQKPESPAKKTVDSTRMLINQMQEEERANRMASFYKLYRTIPDFADSADRQADFRRIDLFADSPNPEDINLLLDNMSLQERELVLKDAALNPSQNTDWRPCRFEIEAEMSFLAKRKWQRDMASTANRKFDADMNEWVATPIPPPPEAKPLNPEDLMWIRYVAGELDSHWENSHLKPTLVCRECREKQGEHFPFSFVKISDLR